MLGQSQAQHGQDPETVSGTLDVKSQEGSQQHDDLSTGQGRLGADHQQGSDAPRFLTLNAPC